MQCLILLSSNKFGHLLAPASYRKALIGVEHVFCLTPTDEDSHSATIVVLCFAIVFWWVRGCVSVYVGGRVGVSALVWGGGGGAGGHKTELQTVDCRLQTVCLWPRGGRVQQ